jgi:hypothetical protein
MTRTRFSIRIAKFGVLLSMLGFLALSHQLIAQVGSATIGGLVLDQTGAAVPEATVVLHNTQTGTERQVKSTGSGVFTFSAVPSGDYNLTINHAGFKAYEQTSIHLDPGDNKSVQDIRLAVGAATETVTVTEEVAGIPLDNGQLSSTISANDLERLSVSGRDATELQKILPGFAIRSQDSTNQAPDFSQVQIGQPTPYASNGAPVAGITLKLDGANLTDAGNFGANLQNINDSFVSEVQVQTSNFGADQSNGPVVISGATKAGTAQYHGSLYTYARTYQLNSNDWLANFNGLPRPADHYVYPGGTISGPVPGVKRLTFFAGAEYDAQRNIYAYGSAGSAIVHALLPTAAMRKGDFSASSLQAYLGPMYTNGGYANLAYTPSNAPDGSPLINGNLAGHIDPGAMALVNTVMPLPNLTATGTDGYNYQTQNLVDNNITQIASRVDYEITPKNRIFGRYSFEKGKQGQPQIAYYSPQGVMGAVNTPGGGLLNDIKVDTASANYVAIFTPTLTNELYATLTYFFQSFDIKNNNAVLKTTAGYPYNGPYANNSVDIPELQDYGIDGLPLYLAPDYSFGAPSLKKFQPSIGDNLSKVWGSHTIKAGIFSQRVTNNQTITNGFSQGAIFNYYAPPSPAQPGYYGGFHSYLGQYPDGSPAFDPTTQYTTGNYLANFMEGIVQQVGQQNFLPRTDLYFWNVDFYAQDTWRVARSLVLDFGVRFQHLGPWQDAHGLGAAVWSPSTINNATLPLPGFLWHAIDNSIPVSGVTAPGILYGPRAGFAWDVFSTGRTVLRGGIGMYRMHDSVVDVTNAFANSEGFRSAYMFGFGAATLSGVSSVKQNPVTYGGLNTSIFGLDPTDKGVPTTNNYSLSIAQEVGRHDIVQLSYVGNNSNSLFNNGTSQAVVLNNVNAIPVGTLYQQSNVAAINAAIVASGSGNPLCSSAGCTPAQVAGLTAAQIQAVRPYPEYQTISVPQHNTYANYNGLQAVWQRTSGALNYGFNYTFAKALGILGSAADFNFTAPITPFNLGSNYGPMNFDRTQIFNATYSYQVGHRFHGLTGALANQWLISGITNIQSGGNMQTGVSFSPSFYLQGTITPSTGTLPINNQVVLGTTDVNLQPTVTCNPGAGLAKHQYINGACLGVPSVGTNGQAILPYLHGPKFVNSDLTIERGFSVGGERSLRLRVAAFNFLNHPLNSFGTGYAQQSTLVESGTSYANAAYSPASGFGFAPYKLGRRIMQVSLYYSF